jgi:23S rRNA pseudouridine2605 synthase
MKKKDPYKSSPTENTHAGEPGTTRLNKYIAHCGVASRRKAGELIKAGFVTVNGDLITDIGFRVKQGDQVKFKGKIIRPEEQMVYLLLNKPKGFITTLKDEKGRKTVMDLIGPEVRQRIYPVGRLDRETTGLLLLTNDGDLTKKLSHPRYGIKKLYHVFLDKIVSNEHMHLISKGLDLEDGKAEVDSVSHVQGKKKNEVGIEIHMGKNRIVRRIFEYLGYAVIRLDRVYYGGLTKKDLPRGRYRQLSAREVIMLKHFTQ